MCRLIKGREITLKQAGADGNAHVHGQQGMTAHFGVDAKSGGGKSSSKKRKVKDEEGDVKEGRVISVIDGDSDSEGANDDDDDEGAGNDDDALGQRFLDQLYLYYLTLPPTDHSLTHPLTHLLLSPTLSNTPSNTQSPPSHPTKVSRPALPPSHEPLQCRPRRTTPRQQWRRWRAVEHRLFVGYGVSVAVSRHRRGRGG